jgi:hypothetical protein
MNMLNIDYLHIDDTVGYGECYYLGFKCSYLTVNVLYIDDKTNSFLLL